MSIKSYFVASAILKLAEDADRKGLVQEIAQKVEEISKAQLGKHAERVEAVITETVILPLGLELMNDSRKSLELYRLFLTRQFELVQGRIEALYEKKIKG